MGTQQNMQEQKMDMNPKTQGLVHPEQKSTEYFLGHFDPSFAENKLKWKTKRIGNIALQSDGKPYPTKMQDKFRPVPVFILRAEAIENINKLLYGISS